MRRRAASNFYECPALDALADFQSTRTELPTRRGGHRHLEHAADDAGGGLVGVDTFGQRNGAVEASVAALAVVGAGMPFRPWLPLALDGEHVILDLDHDVVLRQA